MKQHVISNKRGKELCTHINVGLWKKAEYHECCGWQWYNKWFIQIWKHFLYTTKLVSWIVYCYCLFNCCIRKMFPYLNIVDQATDVPFNRKNIKTHQLLDFIVWYRIFLFIEKIKNMNIMQSIIYKCRLCVCTF